MDKLKPCPFCGGKDLEKGRYKMSICCNKCGAFFTLCNSLDPEEIEEGWNRRWRAMDKLKPCPFCGGAASVYEDARLTKAPYDAPKWYISCHGCGVQTPIATMYAIVKIWNRRASDA